MFENVTQTKEKIYRTAAAMFAKRGFDAVSLRELAQAVGMKHNSLYNHFNDKKDILCGLYQIYEEQRALILPDINKVLKLAETAPVYDALMLLDYHFPPDIEPLMRQITAIAAKSIEGNDDSAQFVVDNIYSNATDLLAPVLKRLAELGRIEPVEIERVCSIMCHYCYSFVAIQSTRLTEYLDSWVVGLDYLYRSHIKPTGK